MRIILMIGPQGSGKGTQAERLAARLHFPAVSLGQMLRAEVDSGSAFGREAAEVMKRGDRLPEKVVNRMAYERLLRPDAREGAILDGYPRSQEQASDLDAVLRGIDGELTDAVFLNVSDEESMRRLSGRWVCSNVSCEAKYHAEFQPPAVPGVCDRCGSALMQRADDTPAAIAHRLEVYHRDTAPLIAYYRDRGVLREIDGAQSIEKVEQDIAAALGLGAANV